MSYPIISAATAGALVILQILLAFFVSGIRGQRGVWIGDGGDAEMQRLARRHANLAENAGLFVAGFTLLELSGWQPVVLLALCPAFLVVRLCHAIGLSSANTNNVFRLVGGVGTYLVGFALGGALLWVSLGAASVRYV